MSWILLEGYVDNSRTRRREKKSDDKEMFSSRVDEIGRFDDSAVVRAMLRLSILLFVYLQVIEDVLDIISIRAIRLIHHSTLNLC